MKRLLVGLFISAVCLFGQASSTGRISGTGTQLFVTNAQTSAYQVLPSDFEFCKTIPVASGSFTITLVASTSQPANGECVLILNYGSGTVTVAPSGQNINGSSSNQTVGAGSASAPLALWVVSDGTNYEAYKVSISSSSGTVTSVTIAGTANQITATGTCTITTTGTCTLSLPNTVDLGTDGSAAGQLQLSNGSASAHTIWGSAATTSNTILGFATAPTTGDLVDCATSSTTCTLTDSGVLAANVVTNSSNFTADGVIYATGNHTVLSTAAGTSGQVLTSNGAGMAPTYQSPTTGTVTSVTIAGTSNQITATGTCTITTTGTCTLSLPNTVDLGTDGSAAGQLQLSNSSASAHTIWGSAATTSNTILGFATAPTTGDLVDCATSSTTCTLTDSGVLAANVNVLSHIKAATGSNTIASGNNSGQVWNWALTSNSTTAFTFGETTAASGTGDILLATTTLAGSTAIPHVITDSLTGSQTLPALEILPTWNTTGVVDAAILVNVTNTASGAGSLIEDLQIGGSSQFTVSSVGIVNIPQAPTSATYDASYQLNSNNAVWQDATNGNLAIGPTAYPTTVLQSGGAGHGQDNVAIGAGAMNASTTSYQNVAVGYNALHAASSGGPNGNTAVGYDALNVLTSGSIDTAVGASAGDFITSGSANTLVGAVAGGTLSSGGDNTVVGYSGGGKLTSSSNNTLVGFEAGYNITNSTGGNNVAVGYQAGYDLATTGTANIIIGYYNTTGVGITTGANNINIGQNLQELTQTGSNQLDIGNLIFATGLASGTTLSTGKVGIGVVSPSYGLDLGGSNDVGFRSLVSEGSTPSISGCSAGTQTGGATAGTFASGTSGTCTVIFTFALTAPHGWFISAADTTTTTDTMTQSAYTTTTATITGTTVSGDVITWGARAF